MAWTDVKPALISDSVAAIWGLYPTDIWAAGVNRVFHFDGSSWSAIAISASAPMSFMGFSTSDVFVACFDAGAGDKILRWDGATWNPTLSGIADQFLAIWGVSSADVWACGVGGSMWHWDGISWSSVASGTPEDLWAIHGVATDDIWAVGTNGSTIHWDGATWSVVANGMGLISTFTGVFAYGPSKVILVGKEGVVAYYDGAVWTQIVSGYTFDFHAITFVSTNGWILGGFEFFMNIDISGPAPLLHPVTEDLGYVNTWLGTTGSGAHDAAIVAFSDTDAWAASVSVQLYHWDGPGSSGGGSAPVVTVVSPAGSQIDATTQLIVDVTCATSLERAVLIASDPALKLTEIVHDGDGFGEMYRGAANSRAPIAGGFRYTFVRDSGWPQGTALSIKVIAYDTLGVET